LLLTALFMSIPQFASSFFIGPASSIASVAITLLSLDSQPMQPQVGIPTDSDNQLVQMAFKDFDSKRFDASEKEFTMSINRWNEMNRPRDEMASLLKARANVRVDNKDFNHAIEDYNKCIELMGSDGEDKNGKAVYGEYPDTFVGRALALEGLADWQGALKDYDKAITLWGGKASTSTDYGKNEEFDISKFDGINPYVLTFRGNVLSRLGDYEKALKDYDVSSNIFISLRDIARYSDARANYALALYQLKREDEAVKAMNDVIRKNPGYADMHVAIAADAWSRGNYVEALKEWRFTCDRIDVGCEAYKDDEWVSTVRRWPATLSSKLQQFLRREIPEALKGKPGDRLAPVTKYQ